MAYDPLYRRRVGVTVARAAISVVAFALGFGGFLLWLDNSNAGLFEFGDWREALGFSAVGAIIPLVWALLGGAVLDHKMARRGPWWPLLFHSLGLTAAGALVVIVAGAIIFIQTGMPYAFLAVFYLVPLPLIGVMGVFLTWLVPGSFPRRGNMAPPPFVTMAG